LDCILLPAELASVLVSLVGEAVVLVLAATACGCSNAEKREWIDMDDAVATWDAMDMLECDRVDAVEMGE